MTLIIAIVILLVMAIFRGLFFTIGAAALGAYLWTSLAHGGGGSNAPPLFQRKES